MKYLDDKRKRLTNPQAVQQPRTQTTQTVQKQTISEPQKTAAPAVQPAQTQAAPKVMEQHGSAQGQTTAPAQPTEAVAQAQQLISQQMQNFRGSNAGAVDDLMAQIQNREAFEYDVNTDPTYLMLRDIWSQDGKMAMEDTMGQAARLTGGYGNSYAQAAGQQMYQGYMRELNEMVPQLEQAARSDYDAETEAMLRNLALLQQQDEQEYNRFMDFLAQQYQEGRDAVGDQRYDQEWQYQQDRDKIEDARYEQEWAYQQEQDEKDYALNLALAAYEMGDDSLVKALGINPQEYGVSYGSGGSSGGGSRGSGSGGSSDNGGSGTSGGAAGSNAAGSGGSGVKTPQELGDPFKKDDYVTVTANCAVFAGNGASASEISAYLKEALNEGSITEEQYKALMAKYGNLAGTGNGSNKGGSGSSGGGSGRDNRYNAFN